MHVRSEVGILPCLVVVQVLRSGNAETPFTQLFVREFSSDWHKSDCALHRRLDLNEDLLDLGWEMSPPRVHEMPYRRAGAEQGDQHCANSLVCLAFLAPHENNFLVVA